MKKPSRVEHILKSGAVALLFAALVLSPRLRADIAAKDGFSLLFTPAGLQEVSYRGRDLFIRDYRTPRPDEGRIQTACKEFPRGLFLQSIETYATEDFPHRLLALDTTWLLDGELHREWNIASPSDKGSREIGFYLPESFFRPKGVTARADVTFAGGRKIQLDITDQPFKSAINIRTLKLIGPAVTLDFDFSVIDYPGSYGWHVQDYRQNAKSAGLIRIVFSAPVKNPEGEAHLAVTVRIHSRENADDKE